MTLKISKNNQKTHKTRCAPGPARPSHCVTLTWTGVLSGKMGMGVSQHTEFDFDVLFVPRCTQTPQP